VQCVWTYCTRKAPDPVLYGRTSEMGPVPFSVGSGLLTAGPRVSRVENTRTLLKQGSGGDMCPDPTGCEHGDRTFLFPGQAKAWCSQAACCA
jgi:hypothetical protein